MPTIEIDLPASLKKDVEILAKIEGIDVNTFILLALAEKIGELRAQNNPLTRMKPLPLHTVIDVEAMGELSVRVRFEDGLEGIYTIDGTNQQVGIYSALLDKDAFNSVEIGGSGKFVVWKALPTITIDAQTIYWQLFIEGEI